MAKTPRQSTSRSGPAETLAAAIRAHQAGALAQAKQLYATVLHDDPGNADALHFLGLIAAQEKQPAEAERLLRQAIERQPQRALFHANLGKFLVGQKRPHDAEPVYWQALALDANMPQACNGLGGALLQQSRYAEAVPWFERAVNLNARYAEAWINLGNALAQIDRLEEAATAYRRAIAINPDRAETHSQLGMVLRRQGKAAEALAAHRKSHTLDPTLFRARWRALNALPILYDSKAAIDAERARFAADLADLEQQLQLDTPDAIERARHGVSGATNFHLHYQGRNDLALQRRYGGLVHRIAAAAYPEDAGVLTPRQKAAGEKLRIGFVSAFFYLHSIYKTHGRWITGLDPARHEKFVFHLGTIHDHATEDLATNSTGFVSRLSSQRDWVDAIRGQDLDVLIYPDIGMDVQVQMLSALRLAPVQCNGGGHPVTSGLPTIDYFLSSAMMEPQGAEQQYSERLVLLSNLATDYAPPDIAGATRPAHLTAKQAGETIFLNLQSLWKLLPEYDLVYPAIAQQVPGAKFWFITGGSAEIAAQFHARLGHAFAAAGLAIDDYCQVHPHLRQDEFYGLVQAADIILDSMAWSGNNSSMEASACGKPIVTMPGESMRARHTMAILQKLGAEALIARSVDDYVGLAVRLGLDSGFRAAMTVLVAHNQSALFNDRAPIRALEDFLQRVGRGMPPI